MDLSKKRALKNAYKEKPAVGGVCCIRCSGNGQSYLQATTNMEGLKNRFHFAMSIGSSPDPSLQSEWEKYGGDAFSFTVLEEIEKKETQSQKEFRDDVNVLYELWLEKQQAGELD